MASERCNEEEAEATLSNLKMEGRCWLELEAYEKFGGLLSNLSLVKIPEPTAA